MNQIVMAMRRTPKISDTAKLVDYSLCWLSFNICRPWDKPGTNQIVDKCFLTNRWFDLWPLHVSLGKTAAIGELMGLETDYEVLCKTPGMIQYTLSDVYLMTVVCRYFSGSFNL